jgi:dihydrofolate reductase
MDISIIVACDPNNVIGNSNNNIPWNIPDDMAFFKKTTTGHPIIMGRLTWDSFPRKPLPKRTNIVISRTLTPTSIEDTICESKPFITNSLQDAIDIVKSFNIDESFIIGGSQIYKKALSNISVNKLIVTHVKKEYEGTVYFPKISDYGFTANKTIMEHQDFTIMEYTR